MSSKNIHKKLLLWIDGGTNPHESEAIKKNLATCEECRDFENYLRDALYLIEKDKISVHDPYLITRIESKIDQRSNITFNYKRILVSGVFIGAVLTGILFGAIINKKRTIYSDYKAESYYLNEIHQENIEVFLLSD